NVAILLIVTAVVLISLEWPFHLVSKYLARDSKPSSSFVCTGGNCVQNGTQVVDNRTYATQPLPDIVGLKMSDATGRNLSPLEGELANNPGQSATFTLDRSFPEAIFDITCDRPCQATDAIIAGVREPREMHDPDDPNATGIAVGNSAPVAAGTRIMV